MIKKMKIGYWIIVLVILGLFYLHTRGQREMCFDRYSLNFVGGYSEGNLMVFDETNEKGRVCDTYNMSLNKGNYVVRVRYSEQFVPNIVRMITDGESIDYEMPVEQTVFEFPVELSKDVRTANISIIYQRTGLLKIESIELIGEELLYTDTVFQMLLVSICAVLFYFFFFNYFVRCSKKQKLSFVLVCSAVFASCIPLMESGMTVGDDIGGHIQRIEGIKDALQLGYFPARIAPYENSGHGLLLTMYPFLFLYIPAILRIFNVSPAGAYRALIVIINAASAISAFFCTKSILCQREEGFSETDETFHWGPTISAVVFCLFPYRLICTYSRAALGECLAAIFIPFLLAGLYHILLGNYKKWYLLVIGASGIINAHIISVMMAVIVAVVIILVWCGKLRDKSRLLVLIKAGIITILANCAYLVPFLYFFTSKCTNVSDLYSSTIPKQTMEFRELFMQGITMNAKGLGNPVLGIAGAVCLLLIFAGFLFENKDSMESRRGFMIGLFCMMVVFILMSSSLIPYKQLCKIGIISEIMSVMQFPYRVLSTASVCCAFLVGYVVDFHISKTDWKILCVTSVCAIMLINTFYFNNTTVERGHSARMQSVYVNILDYTPRGIDIRAVGPSEMKAANAQTEIEHYVKDGNRIHFSYKSEDDTYVDFPVFFYPGYVAKSDKGEQMEVIAGENADVRVLLPATDEEKEIYVYYGELAIFRFARVVTILTLIACIVGFCLRRGLLSKCLSAFRGLRHTSGK